MTEKKKFLNKEIDFLVDNFFFKSFKPFFYKKRYFYDFVFHKFEKGKYLSKLNEKCENLYFIKEGEVELKIEISLLSLSILISELLEKTGFTKDFDDYEDLPIKRIQKSLEKIHKKRLFKICIYGTREIIGVESFFFQIPFFLLSICD